MLAFRRACAKVLSGMFGFFDSFSKGCGCALGLIVGLVIAGVVLGFLFGDLRIGP